MGARTHDAGTLGPVRRGHAGGAIVESADAVSGGISALTGDVTGSGSGSVAVTIANNAVSFAKMQDIPTDSLIGRDTAGTGDPETITLNATLEMDGSQHLRRAALTGDVTASAGSNATTIANSAVTLAKLADLATQTLIGRNTAGTGVPEAVTATQVLDWIGSTRGAILYRGSGGWAILAPGTAGYALLSNGAGADPSYQSVAVGGGSIYTGTGHPQGVVSAGIGSFYQDTATGYIYRKMGGGSTAYGWYLVPHLGAGARGPHAWNAYAAVATGVADSAAASTVESVGAMGTGGGAAVTITNTTAGSQARTLVNGKPYGQAQTGATSGNVSSIRGVTTVTASRLLDDDIDFTVELRTGSSVANIRIWIGLTSADITSTTTLGSGGNGAIAMRFIAGTDSGWYGYTCSGAGGNGVTASQVAAIAASTSYFIRVRFVRQGTPTAYFSVDDGTEQSLTTNIPATGAFFFPMIGWETRENAAKVLMWRTMGGTIGS